jgi:hypothetical protein
MHVEGFVGNTQAVVSNSSASSFGHVLFMLDDVMLD